MRTPSSPPDGAGALRLALDPSTRLLAGGEVVLGGQPMRMLRLSPAGARLVVGWKQGGAVAEGPAARRLAERLIATGIAHPVPVGGRWSPADVAVVIPARDRADLLAGCLARIGAVGETVVVDDDSRDPGAIEAVAVAGGARVVRLQPGRGPAAARNAGLAATRSPLVAFVDSDTRPRPGWLAPLLAHLADPRTAAVAPRIVVPAGSTAIAAYEAARSPLDLGATPGAVGPGRRVGFVPATALLVRRDALGGEGFDEALRYGEDVDLVWRLDAAGLTVRYEPAAVVEHPHRSGARAWLSQRVAYGSSAGALATRHPGRLRHVVVPVWAIGPCALYAAGRPRAALVAAGCALTWTSRRLPAVPGARRELTEVAAVAHVALGRQLLDAGWRAYPPLLAAAALVAPRSRAPLAAGLAATALADWRTRRPRLDPLRFVALRAADDLAYAAGVWLGCARERTLGPLVPEIVRR